MKIFLIALLVSSSAFAIEFDGSIESYKPAMHSSHMRNRMKGDAAKEFYNLMVKAKETNIAEEQVTIRQSSNMQCLNFYGDRYFECRFNISEAGEVKSGY